MMTKSVIKFDPHKQLPKSRYDLAKMIEQSEPELVWISYSGYNGSITLMWDSIYKTHRYYIQFRQNERTAYIDFDFMTEFDAERNVWNSSVSLHSHQVILEDRKGYKRLHEALRSVIEEAAKNNHGITNYFQGSLGRTANGQWRTI